MEFRVANYIGVIFWKEGWKLADEVKGEIDLDAEFQAMSGGTVEVMLQHAPPNPHVTGRWGGGCCMWESSGKCPSGHHERHGYLYSVRGKGKIERKDKSVRDGWYLDRQDEPLLAFCMNMLDGHRCSVSIVPALDPSDIPQDFSKESPSNLKDLVQRAEQLKQFITAANKVGQK